MKLHPKTGLPVPPETPLSIVAMFLLAPIAIGCGIAYYLTERKRKK